jgi:hypothetical protein
MVILESIGQGFTASWVWYALGASLASLLVLLLWAWIVGMIMRWLGPDKPKEEDKEVSNAKE